MPDVLGGGVGRAGVYDNQLFEPRETAGRPQRLIVALLPLDEDVGHGIAEVWPECTSHPIRSGRLGWGEGPHPLGPLPTVTDMPADALDRRDGVALDVGAVDQPAQAAADDEDEGHQPPHADPQPTSPGFGRSLVWHLCCPE